MSISTRSGLVALALGPMLALLLSACVVVPAHRPYPMNGPGGEVEVDYGDYYYYPNVGVYYSISTGYYFYRSGGAWLRVRVLPRRYYLNPRYRVRVRAPRHRPYDRFREHQRRYPNPSDRRDNRNWDRGGRTGNDQDERDRGRGNYTSPGWRTRNPGVLQRSPRNEPVRNGRPENQRRLEPDRNQRRQRRIELQKNQRKKANEYRKRLREKKKSKAQDQNDDNQDQ